MNEWHIAPQPERITELFFTHYQKLPTSLTPGAKQELAFTVHNLEHQPTTYHYKIIASSANDGAQRLLGTGAFTLANDKTQMLRRTIIIPASGARIALKVSLEYEGLAFGMTVPSLQSQSIQYWATVVGGSNGEKENHDAP